MGLNIKKILQTAVGGGGGGPSTQKKPVSAPAYADVNLKWRNEKGEPLLLQGIRFQNDARAYEKPKYWRKCRFLCFLPRDHIGTQSLVTHADLTN